MQIALHNDNRIGQCICQIHSKVKFLQIRTEIRESLVDSVCWFSVGGFHLHMGVLFLGDIQEARTGKKVMTLYEALKTKLFESVFDRFDCTMLDPNTGNRVDVNQAIKRSLLGHDTVLIYDSTAGRQVSQSYYLPPPFHQNKRGNPHPQVKWWLGG